MAISRIFTNVVIHDRKPVQAFVDAFEKTQAMPST